MNDALGNPVVLGNVYGYSSQDGNRTTVVVGAIASMTEKKVRIQPIRVQTYSYGELNHRTNELTARSINPIHLFPVAV